MNPLHLIVFRFLLGVYLVQHFALLIPYAGELFSNQGVFPDATRLPAYGVFPNLLFFFDAPWFAQLFVAILTLVSLGLTLAWRPRLCAFLLYLGWAMLLARAPFIANPSIPFIGLLLLATAITPSDIHDQKFEKISAPLWKGMWVLMALSYTVSGIHKLGSPSWVDGSAMQELALNPLARDYFVNQMLAAAPRWLSQCLTWSALALEILFAPLCLLRVLRPFVWLAMIGMHVGILFVVSFADLTVGMLLLHLFTFDNRWIPPRSRQGTTNPIVFFDGACVMCNKFARLLLRLDHAARFRLAPLQGETFLTSLPAAEREKLPDSIVVRGDAGEVLSRSRALLYIGDGLGGFPRMLCFFAMLLPRALLDAGYNLVARVRHRVFGRSAELCALIPPDEKTRFLP